MLYFWFENHHVHIGPKTSGHWYRKYTLLLASQDNTFCELYDCFFNRPKKKKSTCGDKMVIEYYGYSAENKSVEHTLAFWFRIDLMHMTSQKGAPACWGSNKALSCAPSPSMQPAGPTPACHTAGPARARALTERLSWERQRSSSTTRAWRQCIRSIIVTQTSKGTIWNRVAYLLFITNCLLAGSNFL